jgi:hypothetical protein
MLLASDGFVLFHKVFGTTPNIAPPSSLKFPASIGCNFIAMQNTKTPGFAKTCVVLFID